MSKKSPCLYILLPMSLFEAASIVLYLSDGNKTPPSPGDKCPALLNISGLKAVALYMLSSFSHVKESKLGPTIAHGYKQQIQHV